MELKLASTNKKDQKRPVSEVEKNGGFAGGIDPLTFEEKPIDLTNMSAKQLKKEARAGGMVGTASGNHPVVTVFGILVYLCVVGQAAMMGLASTAGPLHAYAELTTSAARISSICSLIMIVDAILVNVFSEKSISLVLFAIFLPFAYPIKRDSFIGGHGFGALCMVLWLAGVLAVGGVCMNGIQTYGEAVKLQSATDREAVSELFAQIDRDKETNEEITFEKKILDRIGTIDAVSVEGSTIFLQGVGTIVGGDGGFSLGGNVVTILKFTKKDGIYQFETVTIQGKEYKDKYADAYWGIRFMN